MARKSAKKQTTEANAEQNPTAGRKPPESAVTAGDTADAATIERLEAIAGGADEDDPRLFLDPSLSREADKLDAITEEQVDALRVDLVQDGGESHSDDSSGRVVDEVAEEELARFTEVGPMQPDQGVVTVEPGREDTSRRLRRHHPNTAVARAQDVVEGNLEEPRDEEVMERKVDEGTAA
jgi:hypothetical protein